MGDAKNRRTMTTADARRIVDNGPPTNPDSENPGFMFMAYCKTIENFRLGMGRDPTAIEAAMMVMQTFDLLKYNAELNVYNHSKALLDADGKRIIVL